jgi:hypothetical protein
MSLLKYRNKSIRMTQKIADDFVTFDESDYVLVNISSEIVFLSDREYFTKISDPLKSRKHFWQKNFGLESLPMEQTNAAEIFAGSLGQTLELTPSEMRSTLEQADNA